MMLEKFWSCFEKQKHWVEVSVVGLKRTHHDSFEDYEKRVDSFIASDIKSLKEVLFFLFYIDDISEHEYETCLDCFYQLVSDFRLHLIDLY